MLGFLLLLIAFQAPLIAAIGVLANLLSTGAAFGVATLIFQHGHLSGLLGFESQGFLDAWGPIFFFAMIFAIAMDYTVFLHLAGSAAWYLPAWLDRILPDVHFGHGSASPKVALAGEPASSSRPTAVAAGSRDRR